MIATILVKWNFNIRFLQFSFLGQMETEVANVEPALHPHVFIISLNGKQWRIMQHIRCVMI